MLFLSENGIFSNIHILECFRKFDKSVKQGFSYIYRHCLCVFVSKHETLFEVLRQKNLVKQMGFLSLTEFLHNDQLSRILENPPV